MPPLLLGALSKLTGGGLSAAMGIDRAGTAAVKIGVGALAAALGIGVGALFGFVNGVRNVTAEMLLVARQISSIRNDTGRGLGESARGYQSLRAAGLSGQGASSFLSQAGPMADKRAGYWGLPSLTDANFATKLAQKSQGMSFLGRQSMLESISGGAPSAELKQLANTRPESIRREQNYQSKVQNALGVTPEAIRRLSDEYPLLQNRMSMFTETVKMRFVSQMLPLMEQGLDRASVFLESKSGLISKVIENTTRWLYVEGPLLLATGARMGLNAIEMLTNGLFSFGDGLSAFLRAIGQGQSGLFSFFEFLGSTIDSLVSGANALGLTDAQTDIAGDMANWRNSGTPEKWADNIDGFVKDGRQKVGGVLGGGRSALDEVDKFLGNRDKREADFSTSIKELTVATKQGSKDVVSAIEKNKPGAQGDKILDALRSSMGRESFLASTR